MAKRSAGNGQAKRADGASGWKAVELALFTPGLDGRAGVNVLVWGPPGVGKTARIRAMFARRDEPVVTLIAAIRDPTDFGGMPVPDMARRAVDLLPAGAWLPRLAGAGRGALFLDEISSAPPAVQAALLRVVLDRAVGDVELPAAVRIVAAANPADVAAGGWELSPPLANRFVHVEVGAPTPAEWCEWLLRQTDEGRADAPPGWQEEWRRTRSLAAGFMIRRPSLLLDMPSDEARAGRAWPSPRSWEMGLRAYTAARLAGDAAAAFELVCGAVGTGAGSQFCAFVRESDLPDPRELLADPEKYSPDLQRLDRTIAVLAACAAEATEGPLPGGVERAALVEACWRLVRKTAKAGAPDVAVPAVARLLGWREDPLARGEEEVAGLREMLPMLVEVGLVPREAAPGKGAA